MSWGSNRAPKPQKAKSLMKAELVFNDLSLLEADSTETARGWFTDAFSAVAELIAQNICNPVLNAEQDLYSILLTDDYGFIEWLDELDYQDDLRLLAQQITTKTPVHEHLKVIDENIDDFCRSEFFIKAIPEQICNALGVALICDGISLSFPSQPQWYQSAFIEIVQVLYGTELEVEKTLSHRVRSVSKVEHVNFVVRDWRRSVSEKIDNTDELLKCWKAAFPYLDLCCEYENKFLPVLAGETLKSVRKRLKELDNDCHRWAVEETAEISYSMRARPDSTGTMKNSELANMRLATCPNNGKQHFVMHCDIQPKGYRLYWFEDKAKKRLTIGYAGSHLKTLQFKAQ